MPQISTRRKPSANPPEVMTWGRASLILIAAVIFDAFRAFFQFFWFFGPALATVICAIKSDSILTTWTFGLLGTKTAVAMCAAGSAAVGTAILEFTAPFGVIMADAVGLIGFLTLGLLLIMTNSRMLKTVSSAPWYFAGSFMFGEVPFLGALPVFTTTLWRLYAAQISAETAAREAWETEHASEIAEERKAQAALAARQSQEAQAAQIAADEAANDAAFAQDEQANEIAEKRMERGAANDDSYRLEANG